MTTRKSQTIPSRDTRRSNADRLGRRHCKSYGPLSVGHDIPSVGAFPLGIWWPDEPTQDYRTDGSTDQRYTTVHHAYIDKYANMDTPVHRLDPRAKALVVLAFTIAVVSVPKFEVVSLLPFAALPLAMLVVGGIPLTFAAKHVLIVSPFVVMVAISNPIFDSVPVRLALSEHHIVIRRGWLSCVNIGLKFVLTVSAALALASTTRFSDLLKALERLGTPRLLVVQLSFLYRYLFVLVDEGLRMLRAREGRNFGGAPFGWRLRAVGGIVGVLFVRTLDRADRVYAAMASRGFDGSVRTLHTFRLGLADYVFATLALAFSVGLRCCGGSG